MKMLTLPQPLATLIVLGEVPVINQLRPPAFEGLLVIHAAETRKDAKFATFRERSISKAHQALLGVVSLDHWCTPDSTDLPFVEGPVCWVTSTRCVFDEPVPYCDKRAGLRDAPDDLDWDQIIASAMTPDAWIARDVRNDWSGPTAEQVYEDRKDNWRGD